MTPASAEAQDPATAPPLSARSRRGQRGRRARASVAASSLCTLPFLLLPSSPCLPGPRPRPCCGLRPDPLPTFPPGKSARPSRTPRPTSRKSAASRPLPSTSGHSVRLSRFRDAGAAARPSCTDTCLPAFLHGPADRGAGREPAALTTRPPPAGTSGAPQTTASESPLLARAPWLWRA